MKLAELEKMVIEQQKTIKAIEERTTKLETKLETKKSAASTREMTEDDARKVKFGELKDLSHKKAAEKLGLSYGQIYSARGEYTFKHVEAEK